MRQTETHPRKYSLVPVDVARIETPHRRIVTPLPVPASLAVLEKLERHEPSSMQGQPPVLVHRSEGWYVFDRWGNKWLDWSCGVLISNAGNSPPAVLFAIREMLDRPLLSTYVFTHEKRAELTELLVGSAPTPGYKAFLLSTGSEATENCIKLAKTYGLEKHGSKKRILVSFQNAFHGRTMGAQLAGGNPAQKKWIGRADGGFLQVPFPDGYKNQDTRFDLFLETLEQKGARPDQICGVMSESFQGVGPDFFPVEYARKLEAWCRAHDIVLIMDEVQAGFGRPDIMELYPPGSMTSTHSGSPLPVACAVANIKALREGNYLSNARALDPILRDGLRALQGRHPDTAGCVQSRGLVAGIQIVKPGTRTPDPSTALAINLKCFQKGLLMFAPVGVAGECIKIAPALDISRDALEEGIATLAEAMDEVLV